MAEQDIKENEMTVAISVDYLRGLKGKESVNISMSQVRSTFKYLIGNSISDANKLAPGEWAYIGSPIDNYPFDSGYLMGLGIEAQYLQFAVNDNGMQCKIRIYIYGKWTNWMTITLT